jgi:hypothetical protein
MNTKTPNFNIDLKKKCFNIKQGKVSSAISYFSHFFLKKFNLINYENNSKPCVFFGCYNKEDLLSIIQNKSIKIIIWAGSDSYYKKRIFAKKALTILKNVKYIYHISISNYIFNDLKDFEIESRRIPFCLKDINEYNPFIKGKCIYYYTNINDPILYGSEIFNIVYEKLKNKYTFIIGTSKNNKNNKNIKHSFLSLAKNYTNIINEYKKCFIGLRLTLHDGNANTVQELGMCGIKCLYNGDPLLCNSIQWKSANDIIQAIEKESESIGQIDFETSNKVKDYLQINDNFLDIRNYV